MSTNSGITSLESAKYLPAEILAELQVAIAEAPVARHAGSVPAGEASPASCSAIPADTGKARWTTGLSVVVGLCLLLGVLGSLGSLVELSHALLPNAVKAQAVASSRTVANVVAATDQYKPLVIFQSLFKGGLGISLLLSAAFLLMRRANAHSFAMTVCACAIFYQFSGVVVSQLVFRSLAQAVESTPGGMATVLAAQAKAEGRPFTAQQREALRKTSFQLGGTVQTAVLLVTIAAMLFKSLFYGLIMMFLNTAAVRRIFAPEAATAAA